MREDAYWLVYITDRRLRPLLDESQLGHHHGERKFVAILDYQDQQIITIFPTLPSRAPTL